LSLARLLFPAIRWSDSAGFNHEWGAIERGLELGVGGFLIFGGEARAVRDLTDEMRRRAGHPLLIGSDLERGGGQQFAGATPLPPAAALGALDLPEITRRSGEVTARDARAVGVDWVFAPVADVDLEPENPIVGVRAFGQEPPHVAKHVAAWIRGCHQGGALCCAKHFPGHGRTRGDSHIERPSVEVTRESLAEDLLPFRAAVDAGVDSVMTAHVAYPAYDPSGAPATLSRPIVGDLLRRELGFGGLVVTDALVMEGVVEGLDEGTAGVRALGAGCDALLYPQDAGGLLAALDAAVRSGGLPERRAFEAIERVEAAASRAATSAGSGQWGREEDRQWSLEVALRTLRVVRGDPRLPDGPIRVVEIDDDVGGPHPPYPRSALPSALRGSGVQLGDEGAPLVAVYADIRAWKGRPGLSAEARARLAAELAASPDATVLLFSHPRLAAEIPAARNLLAAWGGEPLMQHAVGRYLTGS
jgi:beta-glucosidase-like glycosyl hydrolase